MTRGTSISSKGGKYTSVTQNDTTSSSWLGSPCSARTRVEVFESSVKLKKFYMMCLYYLGTYESMSGWSGDARCLLSTLHWSLVSAFSEKLRLNPDSLDGKRIRERN